MDIKSIYNVYLKEQEKLNSRDKNVFHASSAGSCYRKQMYSYYDYPSDTKDDKSYRLLRLGTIVHKDLEEAIKVKKEELRLTAEQELPDAMSAAGLTQITLSTGEKISINEFYAAHISKANQQQAYQWLLENGHEGIIKNEVSLKFGRGESGIVDETVLALKSRGLSPEVKQSIHPSTLKAFVKEQLTTGNDIPTEPFGVYIGTKAIIK